LVQRGAVLAGSPAGLAAAGPDVVFVNVTDPADVEAVLFGPEGLAAGATPGLIVVDNSTISPIATQDFSRRLAQGHGVALIDAPVSGGDIGAKAGTLSIMVGGPGDAVKKGWPLREGLGKSVVHVGEVGAGQACKACNQVAAMGALLGVAEALALAHKLGLDPQKMIEVVGGGAAGSWQLTNLGPKIAAGDHAPGFMVDYILKDLAIVADAAQQRGLPLKLTPLVEALFQGISADGGGALGTQAIARAYEKLGGFSFS